MPPYRWPTVALAGTAAGRSLQGVSAPRRHGDSGGRDRHLGAGVSAADARTSRRRSTTASPATIGHAVEPAIRPLGFNWKIGIGLITSLAAREVIVGTLGTIYGMEGTDEHSAACSRPCGTDLTPGGAAALLVFFAFAMQCMSTHRGGAPRNRRLEMAGRAVRLHDFRRVRVRVSGEPDRDRVGLTSGGPVAAISLSSNALHSNALHTVAPLYPIPRRPEASCAWASCEPSWAR